MSTSNAKISLSETETIAQVEALHKKLKVALTASLNIEIDASKVTRIDTAALQCLLVFSRSQQAKGFTVDIEFPSEAMIDAACQIGLAEELAIDKPASGLF